MESKYELLRDVVADRRAQRSITRSWSNWWSSLVKMVDEAPWFKHSLEGRIGDGRQLRFWLDPLIALDSSLKSLFPRLFSIDNDTACSISDRCSGNGFSWSWRRNLFEREVSML